MTNRTHALRALPLAALLAAVTPVGAQPQQPLSPRELWLQTLQAQKAREEAERLNPPPLQVERRHVGVPPTGPNSPERRFPILDVMPVGEGLPAGMATDLFGLGLGMTYDDVRAVLAARIKPVQSTDDLIMRSGVSLGGASRPPLLVNEHGEPIYSNFEEIWRMSRSDANVGVGSDRADMAHRGRIVARGEHDGGQEVITADFSSPASGHQLVRLAFRKQFPIDAQPLASDWIEAITAKFGLAPIRLTHARSTVFFAHMDDGRPFRNLDDVSARCHALMQWIEDVGGHVFEDQVQATRNDRCRTAIRLEWRPGASPNHMAGVWVRFVDGVRYHRSLVTDLRALEQTKTDRLRAVTGSRPRL